ncbi:glycerol kinase GlpK [Micrococcus sp.]|uniref:glycerol kinase GlpK n=1 Tax=Micrococcus sp. TaxID=1271 RepID=UPI002A91286E|nr:glycerol kinase GlpK [Micrococcus sp.]MDY6055050.1 glycerol kinase GlpK [Micrococcus sp.]
MTPRQDGPRYVVAVDQGTTSTRAVVVDHGGRIVATGQQEHRQILPRAGWVEHDPMEIWATTREVIGQALARADITRHDVAAVGVTNQRETTVVWDRTTGRPVHNAIVWQDTRTQRICDRLAGDDGPDRYRDRTGLPLATYFSGPKVAWILENVDGAREAAERGDLLFGTTDSWVVWNLTGGVDGGVHVTDVTNASRTLLMDLHTLDWDEQIAADMGIPTSMLPRIVSSSEVVGAASSQSLLRHTPIAGILGDQQAAMVGQACFEPGQVKNTYGTGNFMLMNTGQEPVRSEHGLLTTVCYRFGDEPPVYALEGSVAVTGSLVQWVRDNLRMIDSAPQIEELAAEVEDNGGVYLVPAFSGLFAPHWDAAARGVVVGLTRFVTRGHLARAVLEATAFQSRDVLDAMDAEAGAAVTAMAVDGGMVANDTLMQFQADVLRVPVVRPQVTETTALGAAYAAGLAVGFWASTQELAANWREDRRWEPAMDADEAERRLRLWRRAVERAKGWMDEDAQALAGE